MPKFQLDPLQVLSDSRIKIYEFLSASQAEELWKAVELIPLTDDKIKFLKQALLDFESMGSNQEPNVLKSIEHYAREPVSIHEFVHSPHYLNKSEEIYPKVFEELEIMNSGDYVEVLLTGGIGAGKTTLALYTNAYQLYLLSCLKDPHKLFELDRASEILFIFQSITARLAKSVDYNRFLAMIQGSPYFKKQFPFDKSVVSRLVFPNRIEVVPLSGSDTAAIGQNVFGGLIDELNYMAVVEKSRLSIDQGVYDQAVMVYNSISRRRKSRFMTQGRLPGILCLVSSKKYPGQFTDTKEAEAKEELRKTGKTTIYVYDKRVWDIAPEGKFKPERFEVFIGDESRKPRILEEREKLNPADSDLILDVPLEYKTDFERDIMNALREIGGISTLALFPFFQSREDVAEIFDQHDSILTLDETDFVSPPLQVLTKKFFKPHIPRWVHIDLSVRKDSTGVACGCCPGFSAVSRGDGPDDFEMMPQIRFDFLLEVLPPKGGEILFHKIRSLIYLLRDKGLNIKWISFDSYQSVDMQQILRQAGFVTGEQSMDKTTLPYEVLKTAVYDHRVSAPLHEKTERELISLEMNPKELMVDHPPGGKKDVSDAMAGVVYGITMRRETWTMYDISVVKIPGELQALMEKERARMKEEGNYQGMLRQYGLEDHKK